MKNTARKTKSVKSVKKINKEIKTVIPENIETVVTTPTAPTFTLSNPVKIGLVIVLVLGIGVSFIYNKYWNIAVVNGRPISRISYYQTMDKQDGKQILDNMITESLIQSEAAKKGVTVSQKDIDAQISTIESQLKAQGQTLDAALTQQGMTKAELIDQLKIQKLVEILGGGNVSITDDQINNFLAQNKDQLPQNDTPAQLKDFAKSQLTSQAQNQNIQAWLTKIRAAATIEYQ